MDLISVKHLKIEHINLIIWEWTKEYQAHFMEIKSIKIKIYGIDRDKRLSYPGLDISIRSPITYIEVIGTLNKHYI